MTIRTFENMNPRIGARVFVALNATVIGDVVLGDDVSIWYNVVLRGDIHWIRIGARSGDRSPVSRLQGSLHHR